MASFALCSLFFYTGCARKLPFATVDLHSHVAVSGANLDDLISAMDSSNVSTMFLLKEPHASNVDGDTGLDDEIAFVATQSTRFRFMYGGADLNPILHGLGYDGTFSTASLYPLGANSDAAAALEVTWLQAVQADPATWTTTFQANATAAVATGDYVCFGELGPLHFSRKAGQPSISFPANHAQMLWLSDLAATNSMCLDVHLEWNGTTKEEFEVLLAHNRNTKIIWDHSGWTTTGEATASAFSEMLAAHSNLYLSIKLRRPEDENYRKGNPFDSSGILRKDWLNLLKAYPDRIMVGMDSKYWSDGATPQSTLSFQTPLYAEFFFQLPKEVAEAIANGTAGTLFNL